MRGGGWSKVISKGGGGGRSKDGPIFITIDLKGGGGAANPSLTPNPLVKL